MEVDHKDLIDKNYMLFTELLRLKSIPLIRYLYDEQILTEKEATKTMSQAALTLKAMHLLDNMLKLGPEAFNSLYAAILYAKLWRAADLLEPTKRPHQAIADEPQIPLPEVWPDEAYFKDLESKELEIKNVDPKDARMEEWYEQSKKNNIYEMKGTIKGRVLIINNLKFENQTSRKGSQKDKEGLEKIFKKLGFDAEAHEDLTCDKMQDLLDKECRKDHSDYKCFFLILMSHGNKGVVFGTDGKTEGDKYHNSIDIEDIKTQFYKVKSLERKPKVFIIQACQGTGKDGGLKEKKVDEEEDENEIKEEELPVGSAEPDGGDPEDNENKGADDRNQAVDEGDNEGELSGGDNSDDEDDENEEADRRYQGHEDGTDSITAEAPFHFLVAMSTTEGNLSYRNTLYGSWFIQAFIFVLANYAWKEDLLTLMEKVNELVRRAKTEKTKRITKQYLQVSQITNTFIKRFFFFPGMPLETKRKPKKASIPPISAMSL